MLILPIPGVGVTLFLLSVVFSWFLLMVSYFLVCWSSLNVWGCSFCPSYHVSKLLWEISQRRTLIQGTALNSTGPAHVIIHSLVRISAAQRELNQAPIPVNICSALRMCWHVLGWRGGEDIREENLPRVIYPTTWKTHHDPTKGIGSISWVPREGGAFSWGCREQDRDEIRLQRLQTCHVTEPHSIFKYISSVYWLILKYCWELIGTNF